MIRLDRAGKTFGKTKAISSLDLEIKEERIFGLVGTNGAGKSTLLRLMAGIYRPDEGKVTAWEKEVYENPEVKKEIFFLPDDAYFIPNTNAENIAAWYRTVYPSFDTERFQKLIGDFGLDSQRRISAYSKGMKKQLLLLIGICSGTRFMLCDETFDGLDPVMRQAVKGLIAGEMTQRPFTPVIATHNLRELEDFCEHVGLLHKGAMLFSRDLEDMKANTQRIQCVIPDASAEAALLRDLDTVSSKKNGKLLTLTARGNREEIIRRVELCDPVFCEALPLSLEEIFISETEVAGYEVKNIIG